MFVRKKKNKSGTVSIQIIDKNKGKYQVIKSLGSSSDENHIEFLWQKAHHELFLLMGQQRFNFSDSPTNQFIQQLQHTSTDQVQVNGPELVFGKIFDQIGFDQVPDELFRHLVITRLVHPGSKLKTVDYLERYRGITVDISKVYRFLDQLQDRHKDMVEKVAYEYTKKILGQTPTMVFYDVTTLYFESSDEDDLRKTGFSKDGKHRNPQILLGLLVASCGYPLGYQVFEGSLYEGHTLLPVLEAFQSKFDLPKPVVIADAGLLSSKNISHLQEKGYQFILGGRIKNESHLIKEQILKLELSETTPQIIEKESGLRLVISYSEKRAKKDKNNRERGLIRLEKQLKAKKLTKGHINNRGYNKYLKMKGEITIEIDYEKFNKDEVWDGLKGYTTNSKLPAKEIIEQYSQLWHIEKAFRISKTDLRVRPIYHRKEDRIKAHICIAFTAYTIYKEVERRLKEAKISLSPERVAELTKTMYSLNIKVPETGQFMNIPLKWTDEQNLVKQIL